jgi:hypothetical protein
MLDCIPRCLLLLTDVTMLSHMQFVRCCLRYETVRCWPQPADFHAPRATVSPLGVGPLHWLLPWL